MAFSPIKHQVLQYLTKGFASLGTGVEEAQIPAYQTSAESGFGQQGKQHPTLKNDPRITAQADAGVRPTSSGKDPKTDKKVAELVYANQLRLQKQHDKQLSAAPKLTVK